MESLKCPKDPTHDLDSYALNPDRRWCPNCRVSYRTDELIPSNGLKMLRDLNKHEPAPVSSKEIQPAVWDLVMMDMDARDKAGEKRYGTRLRPHNGRDVMIDAYQEALDLVVYLRQAIYERDGQ